MRVINIYEAVDGTEFEDKNMCCSYEYDILEKLRTIASAYEFYDKNKKRIPVPSYNDVEKMYNWLGYAGEKCGYVLVKEIFPDEINDFIEAQWGYDLSAADFNFETGIFRYDWDNYEWVKVDE